MKKRQIIANLSQSRLLQASYSIKEEKHLMYSKVLQACWSLFLEAVRDDNFGS